MELQFPLREAIMEDKEAFLSLWEQYLKERELAGDLIVASQTNLQHYANLFAHLIIRPSAGVCVIASAQDIMVGVGLYGPVAPLEMRDGMRVCLGNGTFVLPDYRSLGISGMIYQQAFRLLRLRGFTHITGAVAVDNDRGLQSVLAREMRPVSINVLREL